MMNPAALKAKMKETIYNGLKAQFSSEASQGQAYNPIADAQWQKMAESISGIAMDIVEEITKNAQVAAGIATAGGPTSQVTITTGKIV